MKRGTKRRSERGVVMLVAVASLTMLIPMVGLTVDVGYLYASKTRLQASVDGAALAAARALNLGATTASQAATAKQNAVNWFYSNFPPGNWATTGTVMNTNTVTVSEPVATPNLRTVAVVAQTRVPTYFLKWFHINNTLISANGTANRRDVVVMMVLDRSYSMESTASCDDLRDAAKLFTGQFSAGRDRIGMVSFSDGVYVASTPSTSFRTVLGYDDGISSGNGAIDNIICNGGTGTPGAVTAGYNELYKANQNGALNVLLVETDGLPNTLTMDFWDETNTSSPINKSGLALASPCQDTNGRTRSSSPAGWTSTANRRNWFSPAWALGGFLGNIGPGMIGNMWSSDRSSTTDTTGTFLLLASPKHTAQNVGIVNSPTGYYSGSTVSGCSFSGSTHNNVGDLTRIPRYDVYGNNTYPATDRYVTPTMQDSSLVTTTTVSSMKYLKFDYGSVDSKWVNYQKGVFNAVDNAAFRARAGYNGNIPATVYVIGLGGNAASTDYSLLQRMANDGTADVFNSPAKYGAYTMPTSFDTQNKGKLVYSSDFSDLRRAFLNLSSQILRLSQ